MDKQTLPVVNGATRTQSTTLLLNVATRMPVSRTLEPAKRSSTKSLCSLFCQTSLPALFVSHLLSRPLPLSLKKIQLPNDSVNHFLLVNTLLLAWKWWINSVSHTICSSELNSFENKLHILSGSKSTAISNVTSLDKKFNVNMIKETRKISIRFKRIACSANHISSMWIPN